MYNENVAINLRDPMMLRRMGLEALCKELGPVGMACFVRQYEIGDGDYTKERIQWLGDVSVDDIAEKLRNK